MGEELHLVVRDLERECERRTLLGRRLPQVQDPCEPGREIAVDERRLASCGDGVVDRTSGELDPDEGAR